MSVTIVTVLSIIYTDFYEDARWEQGNKSDIEQKQKPIAHLRFFLKQSQGFVSCYQFIIALEKSVHVDKT